MIAFTRKHPQARAAEHLGMIPAMLSEGNALPARDQLDQGYSHGGGWRPMQGFSMLPNGDMVYPGDPPTRLLFEGKLREEVIRVYEFSWVAVIQPDGTYEVCRMD